MLIEMQERQANIAKMRSHKETCVDWAAYTNVDVVDEIDSRL